MAGYDISQSTSESATQGSSIVAPFTVGGGLKIPAAVWYVASAIALLIVWKKFGK